MTAAGPVFPVKRNAKTPLTEHGFKDASSDPARIARWLSEFPECNWGTPTGRAAGRVVLDLDPKHPESLEWWREKQDLHGSVDTLEISTPSTGIHLHFLPPDGIELKSTASQIASGVDTRAEGGYVLIPDSSIDGTAYEVVNDAPIAPLPEWLLDIWPRVGERKRGTSAPDGSYNAPVNLSEVIPDGRRNVGLTSVAGYLWNNCESVEELESKLLEHNQRFVQPSLPVDDVLSIAQSVSRYPQVLHPQDDGLSQEQAQEAVAANPRADDYYMEGADAPRRRFPLHSDREAISSQRERLIPTWMENRLLAGDQTGYDRAVRCGELQARKCRQCGAIQCDGHKSRYCCKQRLCPRCMGTLARKPLWKKQSLLEQESDLTGYVTRLGSYDVDPESPYVVGTAREVVGWGYKWLTRLTEMKDCPDAVKTSFSGFRADLHQGYLTLDLVLLGPASFGAAAYLRGYFEQATEREVDVEVVGCTSADDAINLFGNLLSSMAIYNTPDECQTLMDAFKNRRLVQPRGRFMQQASQPEEDESPDNSEAPQTPQKGGGEKASPCHLCGGLTDPAGRRNGPWKKVIGEYSGQVFWFLKEPPGSGRVEANARCD